MDTNNQKMKLTHAELHVVRTPPPGKGGHTWYFVELHTDVGIKGTGEAYWPPYRYEASLAILKDVARRALGRDPFDVERLWRDLYAAEYSQHPDIGRMACVGAVDMACWDIIGKSLGKPIYALMGGKYRDRIRSYTYLYATEEQSGRSVKKGNPQRDPQLAVERTLDYVEQGFTAVKLDPIDFPAGRHAPWHPSLEEIGRVEKVLAALRNAVGDRCDLLVGTHGQFTTEGAKQVGRAIEPYRPLWFEEPVPPDNIPAMREVAQSTVVPVATGERCTTKYEFARLLEVGVSILQPDFGRVGGILEAKKIAGMAETYNAMIAPHLWVGPVAAAAEIQFDTCTPNFLIQESIEQMKGFHNDLVGGVFRWEAGYLLPLEAPGIGVELDQDVLEAHRIAQDLVKEGE